MDYQKLLDHSYAMERAHGESPPGSRLEFLGEHVFDFTTYDATRSADFARRAVEVCAAITEKKTFDYIKDKGRYTWFLIMCNMPFFAGKIEWGSSIRGAWWGGTADGWFEVRSCGLWIGDDQLLEPLRLDRNEWEKFVSAVASFASLDAEADRASNALAIQHKPRNGE